MRYLLYSAVVVCLSGGCLVLSFSEMDRFWERNYVYKKEALVDKLEGPYKVKDVVSPNSLQVERNGERFTVIFRGCSVSGVKDVDWWATKALGTVQFHDIYLLRDSIVKQDKNTLVGVVYVPAYREFVGKNDAGESLFDNKTYTLRPLQLIMDGYTLLNHSDTNYSLYAVFAEAENLAKKNRKGYWTTHKP